MESHRHEIHRIKRTNNCKPMKDFLKEMLSSSDGASYKRGIGFLLTLLIVQTSITNQLFGKPIVEFIFNGVVMIVVITITGTVAEKFSNRNTPKE